MTPRGAVLCCAGLDHSVKVWAPTREDPELAEQEALQAMERNRRARAAGLARHAGFRPPRRIRPDDLAAFLRTHSAVVRIG